MFIVAKRMVPKGYRAITLFPFVFLRSAELKQDVVLMNHERIHLRQQLELLVLPFYLWYGLEFCIHWLRLRSKKQAYRNISFEREAFAHETEKNYIKRRKMWAWCRYLKSK